jgi:octaprenyl-diphosphate synthase
LASAIDAVADELADVEERLRELLSSSISIIPAVGGHLTFAGGKRFRPLVALLGARAGGLHDPIRITAAAVGELLHTATLLHDDVIDGGEFRRGRPAARMAYGNGLAVLTGDFCLARALQAMARTGRIEAVLSMGECVTRMAEGEVAQLEVAGDWNMDRARYEMVIDRKTAALIAWCSSVGGLVSPEYRGALHEYGLQLGYAFQIADDVIDVVSGPDRSGKARGQDLREGKATLPLILACERAPNLRDRARAVVGTRGPVDLDAVTELLDAIEATGGTAAARAAAQAHAAAAERALDALPPSPARAHLAALARFVVERES